MVYRISSQKRHGKKHFILLTSGSRRRERWNIYIYIYIYIYRERERERERERSKSLGGSVRHYI
jgi:hypothetical protein